MCSRSPDYYGRALGGACTTPHHKRDDEQAHRKDFAFRQSRRHIGFETVPFETVDDLCTCEREDVVVGGLGVVRARLRALGVDASEIDYPEELRPFLGRRLWKTTIDHVSTEVGAWPLFVKPVEGKRFTGCVVASTRDLIGKGCCGEDFPVICSEVVDFVSEYRCFVKYGKILDVRHYRGDWSTAPCREVSSRRLPRMTARRPGTPLTSV